MGWKDSRKHAAERPEFVSLKKDGESVTFIPLSEPEPTTKPGFSQGTSRQVYRIHVLVLPAGKDAKASSLDLPLRAFEAYAEQVGEGNERKSVVTMKRHGAKGSTETSYTFKVDRKVKSAEVVACMAAEKTIVTVF